MTIDSAFVIQTGILAIGGGAVSFIIWGFKRTVIDKIDTLSVKVDALAETVAEMAVKNAEDHGSVTRDIAILKEQIGAIRAPWQRQH